MTLLRISFQNYFLPAIRTYAESSKFPHSYNQLIKSRAIIRKLANLYNKISKTRRISQQIIKLKNCRLYKFTLNKKSENKTTDKKKCILFFHGGAFCLNTPEEYKHVFYQLLKHTNSIIYCPDYRLSPEVSWPDNFEDCLDSYLFILENEKFDSERIVFGGDSAGGNVAISICLKFLNENSYPLPSAIFCFSPWLDLSTKGPSYTFNKHDKLIPIECIHKAVWLYLKGNFDFFDFSNSKKLESTITSEISTSTREDYEKALLNPKISPIYFEPTSLLKTFPPILINASSYECLLSDSLIFARKLNFLFKAPNNILFHEKESLESLGCLTKEDKSKLKKRNFFASGCNPENDSNIRASVILWNTKLHDFAMFGPLQDPFSKYCIKLTSKWISSIAD